MGFGAEMSEMFPKSPSRQTKIASGHIRLLAWLAGRIDFLCEPTFSPCCTPDAQAAHDRQPTMYFAGLCSIFPPREQIAVLQQSGNRRFAVTQTKTAQAVCSVIVPVSWTNAPFYCFLLAQKTARKTVEATLCFSFLQHSQTHVLLPATARSRIAADT